MPLLIVALVGGLGFLSGLLIGTSTVDLLILIAGAAYLASQV